MSEKEDDCKTCKNCACGKNKRMEASDSLWAKTSNSPSFKTLDKDITVDVAVVGGGITGITLAYLLQKAGKKVAIIEAATLGQGASGYNSAHLTVALDTRYQDLIKKFGVETTKLILQSNQASIDFIENTSKELGIDCGFKRVPGYLYDEYGKHSQMITDEAAAAKEIGLTASVVTKTPLPFKIATALKIEHQAEFHPLKYIYGLAEAFVKNGGQIFENTRAVGFSGSTLNTEHGMVQADDIVFATHTPITSPLLTVQAKLEPLRTYVLGVKVKDSSKLPEGLFWDTEELYHYTRSYRDGENHYLVVGGEDHHAGEQLDTAKHNAALQEYAEKHFDVESVEFAWSAQFYNPADDLPYIGRAPFYKHLFVATGYSGNGLTFGTVAALLVSDMVQGKENAWAALYKPSRVTLASMAKLMKFGMTNAKHAMLDRFSKGQGNSVDDVANDEGKIITLNGKKTAVYKDEEGNVTKLSPICTHAGCVVQWNGFEKTWDCPCHGGRYTPKGEVISGPPIKNLNQA